VRRLREGGRLPSRANDGDAGLDLYAAEAATLEPGQRATVATGIALEIPPGYAGLVLPRSGLAARNGIALVNAPGLIDSGYRGEVKVLLLNTDSRDAFEISPGDRIAQLVLSPVADVTPVEVSELATSARAEGGFGSSGR
jgi:dUTP pyrophosphatase